MIYLYATDLGKQSHVQHKEHPNRKSTKWELFNWEHTEKMYPRSDTMSTSNPTSDQGRGWGKGRGSMSTNANASNTSFPCASDVPCFILDFITDYTNVRRDGNCEFRVIVDVVYGKQEMWDSVRFDLL